MEEELRKRWLEASRVIFDTLVSRAKEGFQGRTFDAAAKIAEAAPVVDGRMDWPSIHWTMRRRIDQWMDGEHSPEADSGRVKSLRLGMAAALGDASVVPSHEAERLRQCLERMPWAGAFCRALAVPPRPALPTSVPPGAVVPIDAAFTWKQKGRNGQRTVRSLVGTALHGVAVREAPVVIRLRKGDDSGWLDLRRVDGRLFRPVLAPGSWREVGAGEFVEALWHGVPWADNPAQAKTPQYVRTSMRLIKTVPLAMDDYAIAPTERSRRDCLSEKAAADAVSARCAGLAVIDGIVHRPTEEPVVLLTDASESMVFWRVDDLVQCDIQQTLFQLAEIPWLQMGGWVFRGAMSFPLGDEPLVWEVLSRWKGTSRRRPVVAAGCEALPAADPDAMIGFLREAVSTGPLHPASKVLDEVPKSAWDWRSPDEVDPAVVAVVRVAAMASAAAERMDEDAGRGLRLVAAVAATLARRLPNIRLRTE